MAKENPEGEGRWDRYYQISRRWPPREILRHSLQRFDMPGFAIDLGCGTGTDSRYLLDQGWRVLAIDAETAAIETLLALTPEQSRLQTKVAAFESLIGDGLPQADLVFAGNSLPFCHPDRFEVLWQTIWAAIRPGGCFAGDVFGHRHFWLGRDDVTFHDEAAFQSLLDGLTLEYKIEEEGDQMTSEEGFQHWHAIAFCARKPIT